MRAGDGVREFDRNKIQLTEFFGQKALEKVRVRLEALLLAEGAQN